MANMSHCRFHNTVADLLDCIDALGQPVSKAEAHYAKRLVELCIQVAQDYGDTDDDGNLTGDANYEPEIDA